MSLDEDIAYSLYDRMIKVVTGADLNAGVPSAFDSKETMFVMAQRGMALNADDYRNPFSPGNLDGDINATRHIAELVDDIVAPNPMYTPYGGNVSIVYKNMIEGVHVYEPPPSPEIQAAWDRNNKIIWEDGKDEEGRPIKKKTQLADEEEKAHNNYIDAQTAYIGTWVAAQEDPILKKTWPLTAPTFLSKVERAFKDWGASGRDKIASANAQLATLNEGQVAKSFGEAQLKMDGYKTGEGLEKDKFYRSKIDPSDWYSSDAKSWPKFTFGSTQFNSSHSTEATSWGAKAGLNVGLWSFGGSVSHSDRRESMSEETQKIGIKFSYRICTIRRQWMDASLFRLPNWDVGTFAGPGGIAGGSNPLMPMYPIALVLVRDVEITGEWGKTDSEHIAEATTASASVGWGPFAVSGNYSKTSTDSTFNAETMESGFRIPVIQCIGMVCSKVPFCPPNS